MEHEFLYIILDTAGAEQSFCFIDICSAFVQYYQSRVEEPAKEKTEPGIS